MLNPHASIPEGRARLLGATSVFGVLLLWCILSGFNIINAAKLPAPWDVASATWSLVLRTEYVATADFNIKRELDDGTVKEVPYEKGMALTRGQASSAPPEAVKEVTTSPLLAATYASCKRIFIATLLMLAVGFPVGVFMGASPSVNHALSPLLDPFKSAPIVAVLPILMVWFGIDEFMRISFLWLGAVVYFIPMVRDSIKAVRLEYVVSSQDEGATPFEVLTRTIVPLSMPRIADATIVAISIMWTYITVAEYVNAKEGLGTIIQDARKAGDMETVFAGIAVVLAVALGTYQGLSYLKARHYKWERYA